MRIIIGSGISGLYIGYQLLEKGIKDFVILEKSNRSGGRILTKDNLELGASIFHSKQNNIMRLIHKLGLDKKLMELKGGKDTLYYLKNKGRLDSGYVNERLDKLNNKLKNKLYTNSKLSLQELAKKVFNNDDYNFYKDMTKEWFEIKDQNAITSFRNIENVGKLYKMKDGLSQIVNKLSVILKDKIRLNYDVKNITYDNDKFIINKKLTCDKLYLCTNMSGTKKIKFSGIQMKKVLDMGLPVSSIRVYLQFKDALIKNNIVSNYLFKWCIYISERIAMVSYVDGSSATRLNNLGEKEAIKLILYEISESLREEINLTNVEKKYFAYWKEAFNIVKSHITESEYYKTLNSLPKNFYQTVIPLEYGLNQAWMEAHLLKI